MNEENAVVKSDYLKMMPIEQAQQNYKQFSEFVKSILKKDLDYGEIPGTNKPSLYKPGAEKLRFVYGIGIEFEPIEARVDYDKGVVDYTYRCTARTKDGQVLAECEGNCNSFEAKFGYVWKSIQDLPEGTDITKLLSRTSGKNLSEFGFSIDKAETGGQYGKPAEYWQKWRDAIESGKAKRIMRKAKSGREFEAWELDEAVVQYRLPNPDIIGMKNTIMKMAQKRAFVGAILIATGASEYFTQDIEDMDLQGNGNIYSDYNHAGGISDIEFEDVKDIPIHGHWYAKLEKCKTAEDVDNLSLKHKETIAANPQLKKVFTDRKKELRTATQ